MNKLKMLVAILMMSAFWISCQMTPSVNCPIVIGPLGSQLVVSYESAKKICENRIEYVKLGETARSPITAQGYDGAVYEQAKNDSLISVSTIRYAWAPSGNNIMMFKGKGANSYWVGFDEMSNQYYTMASDSALVTIGYRSKYYDMPNGFSGTLTKGSGQNEYFAGCDSGKVYRATGDDKVEQIGVCGYFWIPVANNPKLERAILMTKGTNPGDKWCGEMDGTIYVEK